LLDLEPPRPPDFETATALSLSFAGFRRHVFPGCFVCGPNRTEGDGLRIFAGPRRPGEVAAAWRPHPALDRGDGVTHVAHVWAALDCPGYFAAVGDGRQMLLGEMTALVGRPVRIGEPCVLLGWRLGVEGDGTGSAPRCSVRPAISVPSRRGYGSSRARRCRPPLLPGTVTASPDSRAPVDTSTMHT
jgi:hypothetical protein